MKKKISKMFLRIAIWGLVAFLVGFFAAQLFTGFGSDEAGVNLMESDKEVKLTQERSVNYLIFGSIVLIIAGLIGYGYYTEKKKK